MDQGLKGDYAGARQRGAQRESSGGNLSTWSRELRHQTVCHRGVGREIGVTI